MQSHLPALKVQLSNNKVLYIVHSIVQVTLPSDIGHARRHKNFHRHRPTPVAPASAENFANFRQLPFFHARLLSEYQNVYSTTGVVVSESPQAIYPTCT